MTRADTPRANAKRTLQPKYFEARNAERITPEPEYSQTHAKRITPNPTNDTHGKANTNAEQNARTENAPTENTHQKKTALRKYALIPAYFFAALSAKYRAPA